MESLKLAIARDDAFCFYYQENIRALVRVGFEPVYFSPLENDGLPEGAAGLYIGGGYPELHAEKLAGNERILVDIKQKIGSGLPIFAECGGFMYLTRAIYASLKKTGEIQRNRNEILPQMMATKDFSDGLAENNLQKRTLNSVDIICNPVDIEYRMCGVFDAECVKQDKLVRFGYVEMTDETGKWLDHGDSVRGHEFHYYDSSDNGDGALIVKASTGRSYREIHITDTIWAGWPHLYLASSDSFARNFFSKCKRYVKGN